MPAEQNSRPLGLPPFVRSKRRPPSSGTFDCACPRPRTATAAGLLGPKWGRPIRGRDLARMGCGWPRVSNTCMIPGTTRPAAIWFWEKVLSIGTYCSTDKSRNFFHLIILSGSSMALFCGNKSRRNPVTIVPNSWSPSPLISAGPSPESQATSTCEGGEVHINLELFTEIIRSSHADPGRCPGMWLQSVQTLPDELMPAIAFPPSWTTQGH